MNEINWYPGHMAKAKRLLTENLKIVDAVVEVIDARAPISTRNPDIEELFKNKYRILVLNKADLACESETDRWIHEFNKTGETSIALCSLKNIKKDAVLKKIESAVQPIVEKYKQKGINKTIRAIVVGIPNVGKSTLINKLSGQNVAKTGDKPGVTKGKQWIHITKYFELLDTPGLLWPKLDDQDNARHLTYINAIRDEILDKEEIAQALIAELLNNHELTLSQYAPYLSKEDIINHSILSSFALKNRFVLGNNEPDELRAANCIIDDYRKGRIGRITFETVDRIINANTRV